MKFKVYRYVTFVADIEADTEEAAMQKSEELSEEDFVWVDSHEELTGEE